MKLNYSPSLLLTVASVLKITDSDSNHLFGKKPLILPTFGKIESVVPKDEPSMHSKLKIASVPCTLTSGHKAAWGGFQNSNVTKSYLENVVIRHRLDLVELRHFCMYPPF